MVTLTFNTKAMLYTLVNLFILVRSTFGRIGIQTNTTKIRQSLNRRGNSSSRLHESQLEKYATTKKLRQDAHTRDLIAITVVSKLLPGEKVEFGTEVRSPSGDYRFGLNQMSGDLVLTRHTYGIPQEIWSAGVVGGWRLSMQKSDGNLVVRDSNGDAIWSTRTQDFPGCRLKVNDGGYAELFKGENQLWTTQIVPPPLAIVIPSNQYIEQDSFVESPNKQFSLGLTSSGEFVLKNENEVIWSAGISGTSHLYMQNKGNLVARNSQGLLLWKSNTNKNPGAKLVVDDNGSAMVVREKSIIWQANASLVVAPTPSPIFLPTRSSTSIPFPNPRNQGPALGGSFESVDVILPSSNILKGDFVKSPNESFSLGLSSSGRFIFKRGGQVIWQTDKSGGTKLTMQGDGNLVLRNRDDEALWKSETHGNPGSRLILDDGGHVAVISSNEDGNTPLWLTGIPRGEYNGPSSPNLSFPVRSTFYYPWYPQTWKVRGALSKHEPSLGFYSSGDHSVVENHIDALEYAHVQLSIASWWGPGSKLDRARISLLMDKSVENRSASDPQVKWSVYHEDEYDLDQSPDAIKDDLDYLKKWFTWHPAWAYVDNRPVIFVYNEGGGVDEGCDVVNRWMTAGDGEWYVVLKVFKDYLTCKTQPDSWHQYAPGKDAIDESYAFGVSPGFWRAYDEEPKLKRVTKPKFCANVQRMVQSPAQWHLITTFNEAGEGTMIESSEEWKSNSGYGYYLDCLHDYP